MASLSEPATSIFKVFVYGTLKCNEPNHHWLTDHSNGQSKFLSYGQTVEKYPLVIGTRYNIPFLLDKKGMGHYVEGEIYAVDAQMLARLDVLEDYPHYYDREIQEIKTEKEKTECWVYLIRKFPEHMLQRSFLKSYTNTPDVPYVESYTTSSEPTDLFDDFNVRK